MKGKPCPKVETANKVLKKHGFESYPPGYICQEWPCSECGISKIANGKKEYFPLR